MSKAAPNFSQLADSSTESHRAHTSPGPTQTKAFLHNNRKDSMPRQKPLERAVQYVLTHWERGEKLKEISAQFAVDPGNLDRTFRNTVGTPIKKFTDAKLKLKVDSLLKEPNLPGYKIAELIGMRDQTFYRWFRRMYGKSIRGERENGGAALINKNRRTSANHK